MLSPTHQFIHQPITTTSTVTPSCRSLMLPYLRPSPTQSNPIQSIPVVDRPACLLLAHLVCLLRRTHFIRFTINDARYSVLRTPCYVRCPIHWARPHMYGVLGTEHTHRRPTEFGFDGTWIAHLQDIKQQSTNPSIPPLVHCRPVFSFSLSSFPHRIQGFVQNLRSRSSLASR